ncbi:hypothetical protein SAMN02745199_0042 [Thermosipho atlanticus DSM 15807]|uniref:Uncharacterized protein n=1 Tax=Thermosipho atlanticus DSM 15807 TaxID=1123380 RepID=A0A1M5QN85_9BACT|nr:hypothetical protein SAMN02745199_0042 [Thermosipho atlanticus DSM 15807]
MYENKKGLSKENQGCKNCIVESDLFLKRYGMNLSEVKVTR